ncbi:MAG: serine/threonine protein kinase [Spirochaetota bacterium]
MFEKGKVINDKYRIEKRLGKGNMAETYLAVNSADESSVVIKLVRLKGLKEWKTLELFEREADILQKINHPYIPKYIDSFVQESEEDVVYFLVYEYIEGDSLTSIIDKGVVFSYDKVKNILLDILDILDYLHNLTPPIIHRDINPNNIILTNNGDIYLVDFGAVQDKIIKETNIGGSTFIGTQGYIPLEQMSGRATTSSDIFSLGMTAITLLTGKNPHSFETKDLKPVYKNKNQFNNIDYVIDKMIEASLEKRIKSAKEAINLLSGSNTPSKINTNDITIPDLDFNWQLVKNIAKLPEGLAGLIFIPLGAGFLITTLILLLTIGSSHSLPLIFSIIGGSFILTAGILSYVSIWRIKNYKYIMENGIETNAIVKLLDKNVSMKTNDRYEYYICGYTFTDQQGNSHYKRFSYLHEDKIMELDIKLSEPIRIKYLQENPKKSTIVGLF